MSITFCTFSLNRLQSFVWKTSTFINAVISNPDTGGLAIVEEWECGVLLILVAVKLQMLRYVTTREKQQVIFQQGKKYVVGFFASRRPMWFTHSKRTFMERFSVLSWWATSVQREVTTHLVRHICHTHTHTHTFTGTHMLPSLCAYFRYLRIPLPTDLILLFFTLSCRESPIFFSDLFSACLHLCLVSFP